MNKSELINQIGLKQSVLCVGLDTDITKIPKYLLETADPVFEFNKRIIDATQNFCVSYKLNTAFYEAMGRKGWDAMEKTLHYIPSTHFTIADAKRGDIGNTSSQYAKTFFEVLPFDAVTVAPYMGEDSVRPFLEYNNKWTIVLGLTSNNGSTDFQRKHISNEGSTSFLYEEVITKVASWGTTENLMFVIGATQSDDLLAIRNLIPHHFLLVPGVGTQGGNLEDVCKHGLNNDFGLLINVSRAIIYASNDETFDRKASEIANQYQQAMNLFFKTKY